MRFNIATDRGILQVEGEPITIGKWKCFSVIDDILGIISIYELSSGMVINNDLYSTSAFTKALELLESHDYWTIKKNILSELQRNGISYPLNKDK